MFLTPVKAPPLTGAENWFNVAGPLSPEALAGKIVLLDFWTFCCVDCMRIIPALKRLESKYKSELVVIGIHSAKFENERSDGNLSEAIKRLEIEHPVINDAKFRLWERFGARFWPTLILIDPDGNLVYRADEYCNYEVLDQAIGKLVSEYDQLGKLNRQPILIGQAKNESATSTKGNSTLKYPGKILADEAGGRIFISDSGHNRILVVDFAGKLLQSVGSGVAGASDGPAEAASFFHPQGLALSGNLLYVADTDNHLIRCVDLETQLVATLAGTGVLAATAVSPDKAVVRAAKEVDLSSPWDLAFKDNQLLIAMAGVHQIWLLNLLSGLICPLAGSGKEGLLDGAAGECQLAQPSGITCLGNEIAIADSEVSAVRLLKFRQATRERLPQALPAQTEALLPDAAYVETVVGLGLFDFGDVDGTGADVRLQHPLAVCWYELRLFLADSYNHKIKEIDILHKTARTIAGSGKPGMSDGSAALFSEPSGLAAANNRLYIADTNNHAVRVYDLASNTVSTLRINQSSDCGLNSGSNSVEDRFGYLPNCQTIVFEKKRLTQESHCTITLHVGLPEGFKLNKDAPLNCAVYATGTGAFTKTPVRVGYRQTELPQLPIQFDLDTSFGEGVCLIDAAVTIYFCPADNPGACQIMSLRFSLAIEVDARCQTANVDLDWLVESAL